MSTLCSLGEVTRSIARTQTHSQVRKREGGKKQERGGKKRNRGEGKTKPQEGGRKKRRAGTCRVGGVSPVLQAHMDTSAKFWGQGHFCGKASRKLQPKFDKRHRLVGVHHS